MSGARGQPAGTSARTAGRIALAAWGGLLALHLLWHLWLAPVPPARAPAVLLLALGPLLLPARGLIQGRSSAYVWACLLSLAYLTHGLVELWAGAWLPGALESVLAVVLFTAAAVFARLEARARRGAAPSGPGAAAGHRGPADRPGSDSSSGAP